MRARRTARLLALALLLPAAGGRAQTAAVAAPTTPDAVDASRAAWPQRRAVELPAGDARALAALDLPPELWTHAQSDLRDLRLIDAEGREVPYVLDRQEQREAGREWTGTLIDARREAKTSSLWTVDLGQARRFDQLTLEIPGQGFAKRLRVEASDDARTWRLVRDDAGVFERDWNGSLRHTRVEFKAPVEARYLRLTADDRRSAPIDITAAAVQDRRTLDEARWVRPAPLRPETSPADTTVLRLELPAGIPVEAVTLDAAEAVFSRQVRLVEIDARGERQVLGEARLHRVRFEPEGLTSEVLRLEGRPAGSGALRVEIDDGDSPPLRGLSASVSGTRRRLIFPAAPGPLTLYYGNTATRAPLYDLAALQSALLTAHEHAEARLGDEARNPRHVKVPPLHLVPTAGAALEVGRWRAQRTFDVPREDIYSLVLDADDLRRLRDDLGDLRLCDAQGRQVPYILEPSAALQRVPLRVTRVEARERRDDVPGTWSLHRLDPEATTGAAGAAGLAPIAPPTRGLPLARLELSVSDGFFSRTARVLTVDERGGRERFVWQGHLERAPGAAVEAPLAIPLDGRRHAALTLGIEEGDNAALTLARAEGVVRVPRVTFKAAAGTYRLLLHNDEATAPRYDLDALRREVLAYSALPVALTAAQDNPGYRRRARDYVAGAPPTLLLWGTLAAAVVALLALTARVLRKAEG